MNRLLHELGYSLQANRKTIEGRQHPDRDGQFRRINRRVRAFQRLGQPVVSVDTKKKELVGRFRNGGRDWRPKGRPVAVNVHDFPDPELGKAIPYGVYDMTANTGWVSVGITSDTAEFAVETIRRWWKRMGSPLYPDARRLLITADGGGSNSSRNRLWKLEVQRLADELGLAISVCHFPPGTSKWNTIEHRMFCHITQGWRGKPLISYEVIGPPDRRDDHTGGSDDPFRHRRSRLRNRHQGHRRPDERAIDEANGLPWRVELHLHTHLRCWGDLNGLN